MSIALVLAVLLCSNQASPAVAQGPKFAVTVGPPVTPAVFSGDVLKLPAIPAKTLHDLQLNEPFFLKPSGPGPLVARQAPAALPNMPAPNQNFLGLTFNGSCGGPQCGAGFPPDTVGDVGPDHFIEAVNTGIGIFSKSGTQLVAFTFNSLWANAHTGTACDANNGGDPTVVYDPISNHWFVADLGFTNSNTPPFYECIAVSVTGDPVNGGWYLYAIRADDSTHPYFPDYPKMGIWPDGLYMTADEFQGNTYKEVRVWAFNRTAMEAGQAVQAVVVDTNNPNTFAMLPGNLRGNLPPSGTPNYLVVEDPTGFFYDVYKFHVDWTTPANSTFTGPTLVTQGSYGPPSTSLGNTNIVPQSGSTTKLDTLGDRLMMQAQYRNTGGAESLWVVHTVRPSGTTTGPTGFQFAQINVTGGTIATTPVQEQTFTNGGDGLYRWIPSIAVDSAGDAVVGYSASNATGFPSIRYAGRLATDPLGTLGQGEATLFAGTGAQNFNCGGSPCSRWGDYSAMSVDPTDDCTFWYVGEYYLTTGSTNWQTRIGSFRFPSCLTPAPTVTGTPSTPTPTSTNTGTKTPTPTATQVPIASATGSPTQTTTSVTPVTTPTATATPPSGATGANAQLFFTGDSASSTQYLTWWSFGASGYRHFTAPSAGQLGNLTVTCTTLPSAPQTFTVQARSADTAMTCTRGTTESDCTNAQVTVAFAAGDQLGVRVSTPSGQRCKVSVALTETDGSAHKSVLYWNGTQTSAPGTNTFCGPTAAGVGCTASAVDAAFVLPAPATLRRIAVHSNVGLNSGETHTYTVRNLTQGLDAAPNVMSSDTGTVSGLCTTNCAFNAGDLLAVGLTISGTEKPVVRWISLEFDGIGTIALAGGGRSTAVRYGMWGDRWWDTAANTVYRAPVAATFRRLYAHSTGSSDTAVVRVCVGPSNPPVCDDRLRCVLGAAADGARCNNQSDTIAVNAGDYFQIQLGAQAGVGGSARAAFEIAAAQAGPPLPTATATASPTSTASTSPSTTATLSPSPTNTAAPSNTPTALSAPTPSSTMSPTAAATATPTASSTRSPTGTATATPTVVATDTPTATPTVTATVTLTATQTLLPAPTASATPTAPPTSTPTATPSSTPTATALPGSGANAQLFFTGDSASSTQYLTWWSFGASGYRHFTAPSAGKLGNLAVTCTTMPSAPQTFTVQWRSADTALTCTRGITESDCTNTQALVTFAAGDQLGVRVSTPSGQRCKVSVGLTETDGSAHKSVLYWNGTQTSAPGTNTFCGPTTAGVGCTASAVDAAFMLPAAATLRRMAVHTNTGLNPGETHTYTVRNLTQGLDAAPNVVSSETGTVSGLCTTNCAFNAGDLVAVGLTISGTEKPVVRWISLEFDGIGTIALAGGGRSTAVRYGMWGDRWWDTAANTVYRAPVAATFRRLYAHSTGSSDTAVVRVCVGPSNPPVCDDRLRCVLGMAADGARCNNQSDTIAVNAGDYFQIQLGAQAGTGGSVRAAFEIAAAGLQ